MSLILDALKKADAERSLGRAPGLQSQPVTWSEGDDDVATTRPRWLLPATGALVLAAIGAAGTWWSTKRPDPAVEVARAASPAPGPAPVVPPPAPDPVPAPQRAPVALAPALPAPQPPTTPPPPIRPIVTASPPPAVASAQRAPATPPASAAPAAPAATTVPSIESLPEGLRRNLPPLALGGSIYADRPADRILIVNGQALKEGDTVDGRVTLESIGRQSATWKTGDQRFTTKY